MKLNLAFPNVPDSQSDDCSTRVAKDTKCVVKMAKAIGINDVRIVNVTYMDSKMTL